MPNKYEGTMITLGDGQVVPYDAIVAQIQSRYTNDQKNPSLAVKSAIQLGIPEEVYATFPGVNAAAISEGKQLISSGAFAPTAVNEATKAGAMYGQEIAPIGSAMYNARLAAGLDAYGLPPEQVAALRAAGKYVEPPAAGLLSSAAATPAASVTPPKVASADNLVKNETTGVVMGTAANANTPGAMRVMTNMGDVFNQGENPATFKWVVPIENTTPKIPDWAANAKSWLGTDLVPDYGNAVTYYNPDGSIAYETKGDPTGYYYDNGKNQYVKLGADLGADGKPIVLATQDRQNFANTGLPLALAFAALATGGATGLFSGAGAAGTGASIGEMVASGLAPGSAGAYGAASGLLTGDALAAAAGLSGTAATTLASTLGGGGGLLETATGGGGAGGVSQAALNEAVAAGTFTPGNLAAVAASNGLTTAELISAIVANPELLAAAGGLVTAGATPALVDAAATGAQNYIDAGGSSVSGSGGGPGGTDVFANQPVTLNEMIASGTAPGAAGAAGAAAGALTPAQLAAATGTVTTGSLLSGLSNPSLLSSITGGLASLVSSAIPALTTGGLGSLVTAALPTIAGVMTGNSAADAAKIQADAIKEAAKTAADAAKFKPVGVTTAFGSSNFGYDANGNLTSAGYQLTPELAAQRDAILKAAGTTGMDWMKNTQTAGQGLFNLGQGYIAKTPEQAAADWMAAQQKVLQPAQDTAYARMQQNLANTGRGGLSIAQGTGMGAANPEAQAYYNALAQQNNQLAASAQAEGRAATTFGQGLMSGGLDLVSQGYNPYKTAFGTAQSVEQAGQNALDIGSALGGRAATAGANAGQTLFQGGVGAANTAAPGNAYNPYASLLAGAAKSPTITDFLNKWINGV